MVVNAGLSLEAVVKDVTLGADKVILGMYPVVANIYWETQRSISSSTRSANFCGNHETLEDCKSFIQIALARAAGWIARLREIDLISKPAVES